MPKLLWISPFSLHDHVSSAAINSKLLLEALAKEGWTVYACTALNKEECDNQSLNALRQKYGSYQHPAFTFKEHLVEYVYISCAFFQEDLMTLEEMQVFYETCCGMMDLLQPDFVMGFGFNAVVLNCFAEAKRRKMWTVYLLLNNNYTGFNFPHVDLILTNSQHNAQLYYKVSNLNALPIGEFFDQDQSLVTSRNPTYITFVNPLLETGLALFAKIALAYQKIDPEQRFLVVNRQQRFNHNLSRIQTNTEMELSNRDFPNVDLSDPDVDMLKVYEQTKLLLMPSIWWESWGRIASEAVLNEIPVVASNSGGLPEATFGAGLHLTLPESLQLSPANLPSDEEVKPWLEAIAQALKMGAATDSNSELASKFQAAKQQLIEQRPLQEFLAAVTPLFKQQPRQNILFNKPNTWLGYPHS